MSPVYDGYDKCVKEVNKSRCIYDLLIVLFHIPIYHDPWPTQIDVL